MSYTLLKADDSLAGSLVKFPAPRVYLGGQCRGRDWRMEFFQRFSRAELTFINPRRENFIDPEMEPAAHARQVGWERKALDFADAGVFWLGEGLSNQAARVEIGYLLGLQKPLLIGAQPGFVGVEHLVGFSGLVVASTLEGLMNRFASILTDLQTS
jgi:hypothetical protein